ncbi:hypothetical protein Hanom_Chr05g00409481 [Helianthus anomalus]
MAMCTSCEGNNVFLPSLSSALCKPFITLTLIPNHHPPPSTTHNQPTPTHFLLAFSP